MLIAVFFVSVALIGWQVALMRCLLVARYHHFSFLVISCALLGFGVGGVVLSLNRKWFEAHGNAIFPWGTLGFALAMPFCLRVGETLPLNVYFDPAAAVQTLGWWCLFWLIHGVPFFLAGVLIGVALMAAGNGIHRTYAANLAGSAAGGLGVVALMEHVPANGLVIPLSLAVLFSGLCLIPRWNGRGRAIYGGCLAMAGLAVGACYLAGPERVFPLNIDQYKGLAYVQRLEQQGNAQRLVTYSGPRGRIDLYASPSFHTLLSLSPTEAPPAMGMLLQDGFQVGSVLSIKRIDQARFLEGTLSALPYRLVTPRRVLILGETGGTYVWLARLSDAESITIVVPDGNVVSVLQEYGSGVLEDPRVKVVIADPRAFLDRTEGAFDIVHLPALEGFSAGSGGIGGLREDYLATVEGFARCLSVLTPGGIACVTRGIQEPERDNLKIAATWIEALEKRGATRPGEHILIARDELSVATIVGRSRLSASVVQAFLAATRTLQCESEWFPGVVSDRTNRTHVVPGPEGTSISWYHHAMRMFLSPQREEFYRSWICNIRPATDDRPFFYDFFRWVSLSKLREAFGPLWPARAEMGFLVLVSSVVLTSIFAALLLPAPVLLVEKRAQASRFSLRSGTLVYFAALGTGFMFVEMGLIQMFTRFLGDPVIAAAVVVGGLLFFAGCGSLAQPRITSLAPHGALLVCASVACCAIVAVTALPPLFERAALWDGMMKSSTGLAVIGPLAFLMGMPFPWGLSLLQGRASGAIPVAWAVNGFASVVSASVAVVLAMSIGFASLLALAAAAYALAGVFSVVLARTLPSDSVETSSEV
ncbi:MAG: hypothetical protein HY914_12715 [Desulfomonile tiedjei]|nr:hypothetical protein [Desulfomonile tiedjei]